jgi:hypothetical protein
LISRFHFFFLGPLSLRERGGPNSPEGLTLWEDPRWGSSRRDSNFYEITSKKKTNQATNHEQKKKNKEKVVLLVQLVKKEDLVLTLIFLKNEK